MTPDDALTLIEDCEARESHLTNWERDLIDNVKQQLAAGRGLSEKQYDRLCETWERATAQG